MDVRCPRCGTEYEFDDALVSERGTTVKCTNCAHQFKIRPAQQLAPERWVVRTTAGRELVYTSLRELQRGITQRQVGPDDLLSRGNLPPRPLGSIAELEPFFGPRAVAPRTGQSTVASRTLAGVAPPADFLAGVPPRPVTLPPPGPRPNGSPAPPRVVEVPDPPSSVDFDAPTRRRNEVPDRAGTPVSGSAPTAPTPFRAEAASTLSSAEPLPGPTPAPAPVRDSLAELREPTAPPRRASSRFIVAVVVLAAGGLLAATVGKRWLESQRAVAPVSSSPAKDERVVSLLAAAQRALEAGDFELAKEELDKAQGRADGDPTVLVAQVRYHVLRAEQTWLELRLLDPAEEERVQATHRELGRRVGRAQRALEAAQAVAADDGDLRRLEVDVLRLAGEQSRAREKVAVVAARANEPENAYTVAALDLAEPSPPWASVLERLRAAVSAERGIGRARAALVYALARAGDLTQAESELGKLESLERPPALVKELERFLKRARTRAPDAGAEAAIPTIDPAKLPKLDTSQKAGDDEGAASKDFRGQLAQASSAFKRGELDRAEQLYRAVLAKQPGNTEALAGLGDVARARRDPEAAAKLYDKVLEENPSYLPALLAKADARWEAGDRAGAIAIYRRVLEQAGPGTTYGQRAAARIAQGAGGGERPEGKAGAPGAPAPKGPSPEIDTSDLPGFPQ